MSGGMPMIPVADDRLGHRLLAKRLASIPGYWRGMLDSAAAYRARPHGETEDFVVTGIGSSEAHARFLTGELNRGDRVRAEFVPLASFQPGAGRSVVSGHRTLVVFSQGLSRNIRLALDQRSRFHRLILFTAATVSGLRTAGQMDRAGRLEELESAGVEVVRFPLENEYEILIRVVGPSCGFLAARLWMDSLAPTWGVDPGRELAAIEAVDSTGLTTFFESHARACFSGFRILAPPSLAACGQNLVCKWVEGVFGAPPQLLDFLSFAHGPFQQLAAHPAPVVILRPERDSEWSGLADRAIRMCDELDLPVAVVPLIASPGWEVIEAEHRFNLALLPLLERLGIDQRDWPGRGGDAPLYEYP